MAFIDLVNQLPTIDAASDELRRAARLIRLVQNAKLTLNGGGADTGDPDSELDLTPQQITALLAPKVVAANALIVSGRTKAATLVTSSGG